MNNKLTQKEWDEAEKEFLKNLDKNYFQDIYADIQALRKNRPESIKSQICLAFTLVDSLSRIHKIFSGVKGEDFKDSEVRFRKWIDDFVLTEKNEEYKKYKRLIAPNSKVIWDIRNSFLHFYSFPPVKNNGEYVIFGHNLSLKMHDDTRKAFREKGYSTITIIDSFHLMEAIFAGFLVQLLSLTEMIKSNPSQYIESVLSAKDILFTESAIAAPFK